MFFLSRFSLLIIFFGGGAGSLQLGPGPRLLVAEHRLHRGLHGLRGRGGGVGAVAREDEQCGAAAGEGGVLCASG